MVNIHVQLLHIYNLAVMFCMNININFWNFSSQNIIQVTAADRFNAFTSSI